MSINRLLIGLALFILPSVAWAQCVNGGLQNCPPAFNPQPGDYVFSYQLNQIPHVRRMTPAQVLTGALGQQVSGKIMAQVSASSGAGFNLGIGIAPSACVVGDVWMTGSGLFSCPGGSPIGPIGVSGSNIQVVATQAAFPAVVAGNAGQLAFVQNCPNGNQAGAGATGCLYVVNTLGTWTAQPNPTNQPITIGGQTLFPGGTANNQGNGSLLQLASGPFVVGHALVYDNNGNAVDSGVPPSGGVGGSGTVTASPQNAIPFYSSSGTSAVVSGMSILANAVVVTNGSGIPSEATSLPASITIPSPTISSGNLTGTTAIATATHSGKDTLAAGTTATASANIPAGAAPTSPVNGDAWATTAGLFYRANGATQGPLLGSLAGTTPIVVTGAGTASVTATCPTCATTTNGGALTATAPLTISSGGLIALGLQPKTAIFIADSATVVHNDTYNLYQKWPYSGSGTINSVVYHTGGTSSPSFTATLQINGVNVTGCSALSVISSTDTTATCTALATITTGQTLSLVLAGVTGTPFSAEIQVNMSAPAI